MKINKYIDYTNLKPEATIADIKKLCEEALENDYASVCVNGMWVGYAKHLLRGSNVKIAAVVGFPLGANMAEVKAFEAIMAVNEGADEIDMVLAVGKLIEGDYDYVKEDIKRVSSAVNAVVKVIFENCKLTKEQIAVASKICAECGVEFVKTSTGFGGGGATVEDIKIMKENCGKCKIKAAGGIRDYATAIAMINAGADRIGTSAIIKDEE